MQSQSRPVSALLTDIEVAQRLGVKDRSTIWRWAKAKPGFPAPIKLSMQVARWDAEEVERFIAAKASERRGAA